MSGPPDADASGGTSAPDVVVDARGLRCPLPVLRLAAAARAAQGGAVLTVLWTDPAARHDVPAWARMRGHTVLGTVPADSAPAARLGPASDGTAEQAADGTPGPRPPGDPDAFATTVRLG